MLKHLLKGTLLVSASLPMFAHAQDATSILATIGNLIQLATPILVGAAMLFFIYGVVKFITAKDSDAKGDARRIVINGIIGLIVIFSVRGLIGVVQRTFGLDGGTIENQYLPGIEYTFEDTFETKNLS
ncbi:hypothetical protein CL684_00900 [Candidatus Campbellbacteria bacterium]|nr:hypothetical protein [Candidatus Campbellbacteria bacterium]|tara:strand:+ start:529 stop:912 length:384 start_codon:yes stop_codon:yes gene_type:complete